MKFKNPSQRKAVMARLRNFKRVDIDRYERTDLPSLKMTQDWYVHPLPSNGKWMIVVAGDEHDYRAEYLDDKYKTKTEAIKALKQKVYKEDDRIQRYKDKLEAKAK